MITCAACLTQMDTDPAELWAHDCGGVPGLIYDGRIEDDPNWPEFQQWMRGRYEAVHASTEQTPR